MKFLRTEKPFYFKSDSSLYKDIFVLFTGAAVARFLPALASPVLTRIFSPHQFGVYSLFIAFVYCFSSLAAGGYEAAIMLPKSIKESQEVFLLAMLLNLFLSLSFFLIIYAISYFSLFGVLILGNWIYLIPGFVFLMTTHNILNYANNRLKNFKFLSYVTVARGLVLVAIQMLFGYYLKDESALMFAQFLSIFISVILLSSSSRQNYNYNIIRGIAIRDVWRVAVSYKNYPKYYVWSIFLNKLSIQFPPLIFSMYYSPSVLGAFFLATTCIGLPASLIGDAVGRVFFQRCSVEMSNETNISHLTEKIFKKLVAISVFPMIFLMYFGTQVFTLVFGHRWLVAGQYAEVLSLWILFVFITSSLSTITLIKNKLKTGLIFNISIMFVRLIVLAFTGHYFSPYISVLSYGVVGALFWIIWCAYILHLAKVNLTTAFMFLGKWLLMVNLLLASLKFFC